MNFKVSPFSSLRTKMLAMFVLLTVIPLIFISVVSYLKYDAVISEKSFTLAEIQIEQVSRDIDILFQDIMRFTELGEEESTIQFLIDKENTQEEATSILNTINFYKRSYPSSKAILEMRIMDNSGKSLSESRGVYQFEPTIQQQIVFSKLVRDSSDQVINTTVKNGFPAISITTAITRPGTSNTIGFTTIIIDASAVKNILDTGSIGVSDSFHIESEFGVPLYQSSEMEGAPPTTDLNIIGKKSSGHYTDKNATFFVFTTSAMTGWKIVGHASVSDIMHDTNEIRQLIILSVTSSIIFTVGLYFFISSRLISPVQELKKKMKQASFGDFNVQVITSDNKDEISELGNNFNRMISQIKSLLQKRTEEQKQLKIAEFQALQAQVNPHFLYNTLDTIIWMAEAKNTSQVIDVTKALAQFFRISLSKGKDWIPMKDELDHVRNYLIIQEIRYQDILEVSYHLNEAILDYRILKLTLQPLVENAIYHGIKNKRGKGFIRIKGDINSKGQIVIDIVDNGIGIPDKKLNEIRKQLSLGLPTDNGRGGFGMVNVHQRIRLFYGEPFGLTINSWYRSGTHICLTIPAER